ncbi:hypothetical protein ACJMK2_044603 [Sinanodonta woodiana]|uniref:Protein Lines n=1 Tax=Sinanodonta woodiana TaxID=1069815 RepID=A0ABD3W3F6_SINWO
MLCSLHFKPRPLDLHSWYRYTNMDKLEVIHKRLISKKVVQTDLTWLLNGYLVQDKRAERAEISSYCTGNCQVECSYCRDLLWLGTCILLFKRSSENTDTLSKRSSENTDTLSKRSPENTDTLSKRSPENTDTLSKIIVSIDSDELFQRLEYLLMNATDPFLTYEVQKTLVSALKLPAFREKFKWLLTSITAEINTENVSATRLVRFLEIYKILLARDCSQNIVLLEESEHLLPNLCSTILVNLVEKGKCVTGNLNWLLFTFFCIWHKIIKITHRAENDGKFQFCKKCFLEFHENMLYYIYSDLENMLINKKVLNIFNTFLSYAATLPPASSLNNCFTVTAQSIVNLIQKSGISSIPIRQSRIGFSGEMMTFSHDEVHAEFDISHLRGISQLLIKSSAVLSKDWIQEPIDPAKYTSVFQVLDNLDKYIMKKLELEVSSVPFCWLPYLYGEQDDVWIEALLDLLDIALMVSRKHSPKNPSVEAWICPHFLFHQFLQITIFDHSVLVDFLASPETRFLSYLLKYLKYTLNTWDEFVMDYERCITPSYNLCVRKMRCSGEQVFLDSYESSQGHLLTTSVHSVNSNKRMDFDNAEAKYDVGIRKVEKSRDVTRLNSDSNTNTTHGRGETMSFGLSLIEGYGGDESDDNVNDDANNYISDRDKFMNDSSPPTDSRCENERIPNDNDRSPPTDSRCGNEQIPNDNDRRTPTDSRCGNEQIPNDNDRSPPTDSRCGNEQISNDNDSTDNSEDIADDKDISNSRKSLSLDGTGGSLRVHSTSVRSSQSTLMMAASESSESSLALSGIDRTMSTLIRLRLSLERLWQMNLFPYNPKPLLKLQMSLELKYEEWLSERNTSNNFDHE